VVRAKESVITFLAHRKSDKTMEPVAAKKIPSGNEGDFN
jgi:hypothetical protein